MLISSWACRFVAISPCFPSLTNCVDEVCTHGPGWDGGLGVGVNVVQGILRPTRPRHPCPATPSRDRELYRNPSGAVGLAELGTPGASFFRLPQSGEVLVNVKEHSRQINDIQLSRDMTMFVTASKDNTAKVSLGEESGGAAPTPYKAFLLPGFASERLLLQTSSPIFSL